MKTVSAAEFEAQAHECLAAARRGEDIVVTDEGHPIARLSALADSDRSGTAASAPDATAPETPPGMRRQRRVSGHSSDQRNRMLAVLLRDSDRKHR